jgi:hypothetical protein
VTRTRRALVVILVIFLIYAVLNDPSQSASFTGGAWDHLKSWLDSIFTFFDDLLAR